MEELDITGLSVGMVVPNYRKMCELLGDRERTGDAKICQLRRWGNLFRYEREGNKFRILEVSESIPVSVPRKRRGEYIHYIEPVLIDYICRSGGEDRRISLIRKELLCVVGLVNKRYLTCGRAGEIYGDISGFEIDESVKEDLVTEDGVKFECSDMYWFRTKAARRLNDILYSVLRSMRERGVIDMDYEYVLIVTDENGNARSKVASDRQTRTVMDVEADVLKDMDIRNFRSIQFTGRSREFYDRVNKILNKEYGWKRAFRRTVVVLNDKYAVGGKIRKAQALSFKRKVNGKILDYLAKEARNDKELYDGGDYPYNPNSWRSRTLNEALGRDDFLETQRAIAEYLIKI